ncbi:MAG: NAD(P) transhydrogenase subunit alpha [Pseudomonadales bacterium]|nr:NAD(P) transhydrogenase subunit alpha [Pseudomonadales bacterium]
MKESKKYLPRSLILAMSVVVVVAGIALAANSATTVSLIASPTPVPSHAVDDVDYWGMVFVFLLSAFIGLGVIRRVSRLLHTPLMSLTNAISAIAVVGAILVAGPDYPTEIRVLGLIALFASVTNIVSGFLITDRMLKMFKKD